MSDLRLTTVTLPTAPVGPENPLPPLFGGSDLHARIEPREADEEMRRNFAYGRPASILPYLMQDGYGRTRTDVEHVAAVLENDVLRATFLLDLGGRLWSLVHKPTGRELLFSNPVLQPANLALRNAWFAGGVEWNIGTTGHSPTTCAPLHAVRARRDDGTDVLRMYEFERLRRVVFQVDACLPDGSEVLLVHVRIVNPDDHEVPMYWWSNIAVPETPGTRVLAPAERAWHSSYDRTLRHVPIPHWDGADRTYPARAEAAADYFFDVAPGRRPWIAALDDQGTGLVQTSTARQRGRKLFVWGQHAGGRRWQEWLSGPGSAYLEIQAGLARTQMEHLPMPARESWSWLEAYGLLAADPDEVHGEDWDAARNAVEARLEALVPRERLEAELTEARSWIDRPPVEVLRTASGWGALERRRRALAGDPSLDLPATPFPDDTLGPQQEFWLGLLDAGRLPEQPPGTPPASYEIGAEWLPHLERAAGWAARLHEGVLHASLGDLDAADEAWRRSLEEAETAWAWRNLGASAAHRDHLPEAAEAYLRAHRLAGDLVPLTCELLDVLVRAERPAEALAVVDKLPSSQRADGRVQVREARAALDCGEVDRAARILDAGIELPTIREGDDLLAGLWQDYAARRPRTAAEGSRPSQVPTIYDFSMRPDPAS